MNRLLVLVEGPTEADFVKYVLSAHLRSIGYVSVWASFLGNARQRRNQGGIRDWPLVRQDILDHLLQNRDELVTTMVDFYGLPKSWPGRRLAGQSRTVAEKAAVVEGAVMEDIAAALSNFNPDRFIPYVVMHEFEGLLFSDPVRFARSMGAPDLSQRLQNIRDSFDSPEEINDSRETSPSHRALDVARRYRKPLNGVQAAQAIGLETIRRECPLFGRWLSRLERLA